MAETTIEWTDFAWNPIRGCSRVSEGCRNCYAERMAARFSGPGQPYEGLARMTPDGPRWTRQIRLVPEKLEEPLWWRKPRRVFVNSMSDLFHETVPEDFILDVCAVMAQATQHTFQVLTKRPQRMAEVLGSPTVANDVWVRTTTGVSASRPVWPLPNVWLGVSVEDQVTADRRIPLLLQTPAAVRFLSCEPLLGPIDLGLDDENQWQCPQCNAVENHEHVFRENDYSYFKCLSCHYQNDNYEPWRVKSAIDWVIVGGESGPGARPMHPEWARAIRDQCQAEGVSLFVKQMGSVWAREHGGDARGGDPGWWPEDLRVREMPHAQR